MIDFFKTTEAIAVLVGLFLTVAFGKLFAIITAIVYVSINVKTIGNFWLSVWDKVTTIFQQTKY